MAGPDVGAADQTTLVSPLPIEHDACVLGLLLTITGLAAAWPGAVCLALALPLLVAFLARSQDKRRIVPGHRLSARPRESDNGQYVSQNLAISPGRAACHNKAAVALANKLARIVRAVWRRGSVYHNTRTAWVPERQERRKPTADCFE